MATPELNLTGVLEAPRPPAGGAGHARTPASVPVAARVPLPPVDPRLDDFVQNVMGLASERAGYTYKLGEGARTPEQQAGKVAAGYSKTYHSKHLTGHGRDVLAFDSEGHYITDGSHEAYKALGDAYRERAPASGLSVKWGGDFHDFYDPGHFEIDDNEQAAPALKLDGVLEPPLKLDGVLEPSDDEEVVSIDARRPDAPAPPEPRTLSPLREPRTLNAQTAEGRETRDAYEHASWGSNAKLPLDVPLPAGKADWSQVSSEDASKQAARTFAARRGIPLEFAEKWLDKNKHLNLHLYDSDTGEKKEPVDYIFEGSPAYDFERRTLRVSAEMPHLKQLEQDYEASKGAVDGLHDLAADETHSPFEKAAALGSAVWDSPQSRDTRDALDLARRTVKSVDAGAWAHALGGDEGAASALAFSDVPSPYDNPVGDIWKVGVDKFADSAEVAARKGGVLASAVAPQMRDSANVGRSILGVVAQPLNFVPLAEVGALAKAGRLGRAVEESGELSARVARALRPLGVEGADSLDVVMRGADGTHYLVNAGTREAINLETGELANGGGRAANVALSEARARYERAVEEAANASNRLARQNAQALADDYAKEIARLEGVEPPVGSDGVDVTGSRFSPAPSDTRPLWRRAASNARALAQLPKAKAGFDLSATGRQGLAQVASHPSYLKEAMAHQVKAFASEDAFNAFRAEIMGRADYEQMKDAGLFLSSVGPEAEEAFASQLAQKIPGVRGSERAYSAALDSIRTQAWDNYVASLPEHLRDNPDTLKAVAELINISTGRGKIAILDRSELGKKIIDALNVPFFSPRNTASKFNLISPSRVVKNMLSPETRPVAYLQLRDASRGLATLGTTLGLLHLAGLDVGLNPFSSDFGKVRVGKAVYDLTGGEGYTARYLAQMAQTAMKEARGKKVQGRSTLEALTRRYLRTQLQPLFASGVDAYYGEDVQGRKVTKASAALDLAVPFVVDDVIKGFQAEGWLGGVKATPGVLGVGVNFYDKPKRGRGSRGPQLNLNGIVEPPAHEQIRDAVESADPDAEPTFREFPEGMSELRVPRSSMPQVKSEHRGAMVQYLKGRGITHRLEEVPAGSLRPSQAEWSPEKVRRALSYEGPQRRILVSSDSHVADGHHQWLSDVHKDPERRIPIIRLDSPILPLLMEMARFPSSGVDDASA